jgi:glycine cleavage system H protein
MSAGLIAYRLCDRDFDCENCPLDAAMRGPVGVRTPRDLPRAAGFPSDRRYGSAHTWIRRGGPDTVRCGLDAFAARLLGHVTSVILPLPRSRVQAGRTTCWLKVHGTVVPVRSPVSGEVQRVNSRLQEQPSRLISEPYGGGWLFEVRHERDLGEEPALVGADERALEASRHQAELDAAVREATTDRPLAGTLPDGGEPVRDLARLLGPSRFRRVLLGFLDPGGLGGRGPD